MTDLSPVLDRADQNLPSSLDNLFELLRIKSISTDPDYKAECRKAAEWLVTYLNSLGFKASVRDTPGHPMVVAHHDAGTADAPHVLFYGHYDVQPVDPLELWESDPFAPAIKDLGNGRKVLTGRGTSDDKGQLMTFVEAVRAYKETRGALPVRITILFEGEEESGSPSLKPFLEANAAELKADFALVCDTGMWDGDTPAISAGLRGLVGEEIVITAADRDLHSGLFGGAAANPIHILTDILAGLHDQTGRITLPGFYEGVEETPANIKASWEKLGMTAEKFLGEVGLSIPSGEKGRSVMELTWARPTAEVNGIWGGYTGAGFKTVIAAKASAKVSFRLVGQQNPSAIRESFRAYVRSKIPGDCSVEFHEHGGSPAIQLSYDSPVLTKAKTALSNEWPKPALIIGMGGSIPIVGDFQKMLGMESLLVGFGLSDDRIHSPNEKYELRSYHKGIRSWIRILDALAS
ncbi:MULTISPECIES: M20/M25/M40 family metallo-hydrolase [Rhizobium]|uniref:Acetylornithine deacetylase/succinyl-diaminopimelate desuccinylase-like protein n=1 Tax=Rhizobium tropici TaxID=398 RepID=A0A6P1C5N0_RHITR|nr:MULTISPECIES: M20/M25/M40 family metallo-hydrolase [Rhizobium]AGB69615.1 peptidase M20 [Rhizobium tropici CIAT 899]MBB4243997.1 acetylornithine deacetylase/succinyl-diaminopimelate desuccinylase-like protein [Rhizobium tropici]MBB5595166.1 acetylornithine deacetylase/succinyl-diaminopimelate desuccinylase-like protein [Rhizobium tropici]MBB6494336.1 acetylornithine deacetylase/succinyl-diaminopimelate desuccinylase-like protein [Rhizobium tropici]NEV12480.1 M20/M25/M40 family metallo-hydrol